MRKIFDFHLHCYPDAVAERAVAKVTERQILTAYLNGTVEDQLKAMACHGITAGLNLPLALSPDSERGVNTWAAALNASDSPLFSLGSVHPDTPDPLKILTWIQSLGLRGIKLHSEFQDFKPSDPRMFSIYAACENLGLFILFHTGIDLIFEGDPTAVLPDFEVVTDRFPNLKIVLAHMGGIETLLPNRLSYKGKQVWFDLAYVPGQVPPEKLASVIRELGTDRVLYGTDSPWVDYKAHLGDFLKSPLTDAEFNAILWENAQTFFPAKNLKTV